jgi:predicted aspartyl protease
LFRVRGRLTGPTDPSEDVELLVDTGAALLVVPRSLADRLELVARRSQPVLIAGGQRAEWPVAEVDLSLESVGPALQRREILSTMWYSVTGVRRSGVGRGGPR